MSYLTASAKCHDLQLSDESDNQRLQHTQGTSRMGVKNILLMKSGEPNASGLDLQQIVASAGRICSKLSLYVLFVKSTSKTKCIQQDRVVDGALSQLP